MYTHNLHLVYSQFTSIEKINFNSKVDRTLHKMPIVNEEMAMYLHTSLQINNDRSLTSPRSCKCSILALSSSTQIFLWNRKTLMQTNIQKIRYWKVFSWESTGNCYFSELIFLLTAAESAVHRWDYFQPYIHEHWVLSHCLSESSKTWK